MTGSLQIKKDKYYVVYRDEDGKQRWVPTGISAKGSNKRKAQQRLREIMADVDRGKSITTSKMLFVDWLKRWMEQKKNEVRENTYECYQIYLKKHIIPYFEPKKLTLSKLTAQHLQGYFNTKLEEGQSACTLRKHNAIINGALTEAYKKEIIHSNPADKLTLPKKKRYRGTSYTIEEVKKLLAAVPEDDVYRPVIVLALFYGLRRSEVLGLTWNDFDFTAHTIHIRNTVTKMTTLHESNATKSESSNRILNMVPGTESYFEKLMEQQQQTYKIMGKEFTPHVRVCAWPGGKPFSPDYVSHQFKKVLARSKLPNIRFHDLRHTAGSLLLEDGVDIKTIQKFLGHSQASTTVNTYLHGITRGGEIAANSMDRLFK